MTSVVRSTAVYAFTLFALVAVPTLLWADDVTNNTTVPTDGGAGVDGMPGTGTNNPALNDQINKATGQGGKGGSSPNAAAPVKGGDGAAGTATANSSATAPIPAMANARANVDSTDIFLPAQAFSPNQGIQNNAQIATTRTYANGGVGGSATNVATGNASNGAPGGKGGDGIAMGTVGDEGTAFALSRGGLGGGGGTGGSALGVGNARGNGGTGGNGGKGGDANSTATSILGTWAAGTTRSVEADAVAGKGGAPGGFGGGFLGNGNFGTAGDGGIGTATATITNGGAGQASATAQAWGGDPGSYGLTVGGGTGGNATATASATSLGAVFANALASSGRRSNGGGKAGKASATALADGTAGQALAGVNGMNPKTKKAAVGAKALVASQVSAYTEFNDATARPSPTLVFNYNAAAFTTVDPLASDVNTDTLLNPQVRSALNIGGNSEILSLNSFGVKRPSSTSGTHTDEVSTDFTFDLTQLANPTGQLIVGLLLDPVETGGTGTTPFSSPFDLLTLQIFKGQSATPVINASFTSVVTADAYFRDHPLYLGSVTDGAVGSDLDLNIVMDVTTSQANAGYRAKFVVGTVPEPCSVLLLSIGVALVSMTARGRARYNARP